MVSGQKSRSPEGFRLSRVKEAPGRYRADAPGREFAAAQLGEAHAPNQKGEADSVQSGSLVSVKRAKLLLRIKSSEACTLRSRVHDPVRRFDDSLL